MASLEKLRKDARDAETEAQKLMREKDKLRDRLRKATERAAAAQKAYADAVAAQALADRDDLSDDEKRAKAAELGLDL